MTAKRDLSQTGYLIEGISVRGIGGVNYGRIILPLLGGGLYLDNQSVTYRTQNLLSVKSIGILLTKQLTTF